MIALSDAVNGTEQAGYSLYDRVWDFFWTPIRWIAGVFLSHEWFPQYAPWIIAAYTGRWPERVPEEKLSEENRELIRRLRKSP